MSRFVNPAPEYKPNSKLFFFKSGTNTQLVTYKDQFEETENTHPVLTDSAGVVPNIFFSGSAKLIVLDENDVQYLERDPVGSQKELGNFSIWDTVVTYDKNDIVEGSDGQFYISLSNGNVANDPTLKSSAWEEKRFIGVWNTHITYSTGVVVQTTDGNLWKALTSAAGNNPSTDDGTNWEIAVSIPPDLWQPPESADFDLAQGESYNIDGSVNAVDASLPATIAIGEVFTAHNESISTFTVRVLNPNFTIKGAGATLAPTDNLILEAGDTVKLVARSTSILEIV